MIILKVTENQGFNLSLENTIFKKLQWVGQIDPSPSRFRVEKFNVFDMQQDFIVNTFFQSFKAAPVFYSIKIYI